MTDYINNTGEILARALVPGDIHRPDAGVSSHRVYRLATPGNVWGAYPLAATPQLPVEQRDNPLPRTAQISQRAGELMSGSEIKIEHVRWLLACEGVGKNATAVALACAAQHYRARLGLTARPNQLHAATELLNQKMVELATGQGKSLVAALAAAVAALGGSTVHVLTANHYLANRDHQDHEPFFSSLGLTVASATDDAEAAERRQAFEQDVCYTTARTVAFDFLRDQLREAAAEQGNAVLRGLCFAIVDEADSLLIDEASMPLVLSEKHTEKTFEIDLSSCLQQAGQLVQGVDFDIDPTSRQPRLRPGADVRLRSLPELNTGINQRHRMEVILQALAALHVFKKNRHYIVKDDQVLLVDQNTGRAAPGRVLPGYLHALISLLEGVTPPDNTRNRTGLTYPRFFARYHHLCGLSGTLHEVRDELRQCYGLKLTQVRSHHPSKLIRYRDQTFPDRQQQFKAALRRAARFAQAGRAVLIGTDNVSDARRLARGFARLGIKVAVLDAANEALEARRISRAGRTGQITIATQIAGRGTDIRLEPATRDAGGLHVLSLQHNRSARIDRQMAGRAARQGDPGSWEHWIALGDSPFNPAPEQVLAASLRPIVRLLARSGMTRPLVSLMQHLWQWQDRSQRYARLRADIRSAQSLQVSTMKHL